MLISHTLRTTEFEPAIEELLECPEICEPTHLFQKNKVTKMVKIYESFFWKGRQSGIVKA